MNNSRRKLWRKFIESSYGRSIETILTLMDVPLSYNARCLYVSPANINGDLPTASIDNQHPLLSTGIIGGLRKAWYVMRRIY